MATSPRPATWTSEETRPDDSEPPVLEESVNTGQFVSNDRGPVIARESLSTVLAQIIAKTKGIDPTEEGFQLYEHLQPEAIDSMYDHARRRGSASWQLTFSVEGETVRVASDGSIAVSRSA